MTLRRALWLIVAGVAVLALIAFVVARALMTPVTHAPAAVTETVKGATPLAHIRATLFYAAPEGEHLTSVVREVPLADAVDEQGRQILNVALRPPSPPLLTAIPPGTTLRGFYIGQGGDAFVDLSREVQTAHGGGSTAEALTVYAIVNSVTANLPAVKRVQILIDGKEVDSLSGHLDLRRPLTASTSLVQ